MNIRKTSRTHGRRIARLGVVAAVIAATLVVTVAAGFASGDRLFGDWAPGIAGDVSADSGTQVSDPPARLAEIVSDAARRVGGNTSTALSGLRELRSDLGAGAVSLYSFTPGDEGLCLVVYDRSVVCPTSDSNPTPGVLWILDGGYSRKVAGSPGDAPPALTGLVTDDVESVVLDINGKSTQLDIQDNTFFTEITLPPTNVSFSLALDVKYRDGKTATARIGDPRT